MSSSATEFEARAEKCLKTLLARLDEFDPDELEADLAGGVLRISFPDRRNCILNRQSAVQQLWLAEGATAWHFESASDEWVDTKGRGTLREVLNTILTRRLGRAIVM